MSLSPSLSDLSGLDPASLDLMATALAGGMGCGFDEQQIPSGCNANQLLGPGVLDGYNLDLLGAFVDGDGGTGGGNTESMLSLLGQLLQPGGDAMGQLLQPGGDAMGL
jgi:hypothetical protein